MEVEKGVHEGDWVVVSGMQRLRRIGKLVKVEKFAGESPKSDEPTEKEPARTRRRSRAAEMRNLFRFDLNDPSFQPDLVASPAVFSRFFIDRPIFATVLSIAITLAGGISLISLPIAMYPPISPPTVDVTCQYPGASAQVVSETIAAPIEQQVNGVENMMYMSSQCTNDGSYTLTVTFRNTAST